MRPTTNPKGQVGPPEPDLPPQSHQSPKCQRDPRMKIGQEPQSISSSSENLPLHSGARLSFTNVLPTKDSAIVHIWYNIPLCNNFSQQYNGNVFRTKLCHSNSSRQINHQL
ncbi:hypothetical protein O181_028481 [Austropuccinia psidii MF-1]|uniref:Uncharacterized protein n=1 Tax=Austropuccinia psidii MF-1 TaxID=1389203 RepID=A0A9Q3CUL3_9BASI|nr:hypothetical protein [Austropuccinia psidii MF-1]